MSWRGWGFQSPPGGQSSLACCRPPVAKSTPAWFADLSTNAHTKEEFMNKNCQAGCLWWIHHLIFQHLGKSILKIWCLDNNPPKTHISKHCTAGPSKRLFGKGRDSTEGGKVQRKAGAAGPTDGIFSFLYPFCYFWYPPGKRIQDKAESSQIPWHLLWPKQWKEEEDMRRYW